MREGGKMRLVEEGNGKLWKHTPMENNKAQRRQSPTDMRPRVREENKRVYQHIGPNHRIALDSKSQAQNRDNTKLGLSLFNFT